jgi:hypothetical protein
MKDGGPEVANIVQSSAYQDAMLQRYNDAVEEKLALLHAAFNPWYIATYYARYYHEKQDVAAPKDMENMTVEELDVEIERMKKLLELAELHKKVKKNE